MNTRVHVGRVLHTDKSAALLSRALQVIDHLNSEVDRARSERDHLQALVKTLTRKDDTGGAK